MYTYSVCERNVHFLLDDWKLKAGVPALDKCASRPVMLELVLVLSLVRYCKCEQFHEPGLK